MKKLICGLSMMSLLSFGIVNDTHAQMEVKHKRGMSRGTKDALIGGAGGAVVGGLLGHGIGGAAVGGAAGAGAGYLLGHHKDKKYGYSRPYKTKIRRYE